VDDEPAIREVLVSALEDEGYEVYAAPNGLAALDSVLAHPPDLILLDMRMPVMDGWAFAGAYRRLPGPHAPLVVVTAARSPRDWAASVGADGVLAKPFDLDHLLDTVTRLLP
jgi:CheY-like chemotaxis protein